MAVLSELAAALSGGSVDVVDLTAPLHTRTPILNLPEPLGQTWPFALTEISRYDERGPAWYWNNISTGEHTGTHFDAPVHWITGRDGADVSQVPGVGVETGGPAAGGAHSFDPPFPCHSFLLGHDKYGLTQLRNLAELPPTGALVIAAPLPIVHGSGSPCRVLALVER